MPARLGEVIYWAGCVMAAAIIMLWVYLTSLGTGLGDVTGFLFFAVVAGVVWIIGRACRYVLSGK